MGYSPVLGAFTAAFELIAACWVFWALRSRGRRNVLMLIGFTLLLLAGYQILEVAICWKTSEPSLFLSRMAFLDITWLPPVSLLLISRIVTPRSRTLVRYAHFSLFLGALMSLWIVMDYRFITGTICEFMYARYGYMEPYFHIYGAFYEITQMSMIFIPAAIISRSDQLRVRQDLGDLLLGSLLFIIP
ncbi:MAG TPA: hypothetical protein DCS07_13190, partial [Bdellovibrionales bacterium]|nr:hypothetical protein [Bdellovibrionales bacterium]